MASAELLSAVNGYQDYIRRKGIDEKVIEALILAADTAISVEDDIEYGLKVSNLSKVAIDKHVQRQSGGSIFDLDSYCNLNRTNYPILELWYQTL